MPTDKLVLLYRYLLWKKVFTKFTISISLQKQKKAMDLFSYFILTCAINYRH